MKYLLFLVLFITTISKATPPNIVLILADDLGYGDLGCYNGASKIPTPNSDRLAAEGMLFTDAHTPSSVCTPTRYGLLTGRYSWRTFLKQGVLGGFDPPLIEDGRITIASFLQKRGYSTACIGKWHLGMTWTDEKGNPVPWHQTVGDQSRRSGNGVDFTIPTTGGPIDRGFDSWFGISASLDMAPYAYMSGDRVTQLPTAWLPNLLHRMDIKTPPGKKAPGFTLEAVLPELTNRAVEFIESRANKKEPFFLYFPLPSPHLPVVPTVEWDGKSSIGVYGDYTAQTDATVGACLEALERSGLGDDTLFIFTSDNGGLWHEWEPKEIDDLDHYEPTERGRYNFEQGHQSNGVLRGTKADIWEGGHRVPFLVRWPSVVKAGTTSEALIELNDIFATVADLLQEDLPTNVAEDSFSFFQSLSRTDQKGPKRTFSIHHSISGVFAIREGPWKYIPSRGSGGFTIPKNITPGPGEPSAQLYRLSSDISETRNLASEHPEIIEKLANHLEHIRRGERTRSR